LWDGGNHISVERVAGSTGFIRDTNTDNIVVTPISHSGIAGSLDDFLKAMDYGTIPMGECTDNIWSLAMVLYSVESSRIGQKVDISL
jgi:hypothetical protein